VVHLGRHSTYEFLPGKAVGLTADDYPSLVAADLPGVYPYIVDGVGEGIQAKRRGLAVIVDHLTPPLSATPLYDKLLELRQVVESFEAANSESLKAQAATTMRTQVIALNLKAELEASMADVLEVRGIGFEDADDDLLAHEIGHYLTKLQEKFMPHGLHIFGQDWSAESLKLMADSMSQVAGGFDAAIGDKLAISPRLEMAGLLAGLAGRFVAPGKGNDPLRSPGRPADRAQLPRGGWRPAAHPPRLRPRGHAGRARPRPAQVRKTPGVRQRRGDPVGLRRGARRRRDGRLLPVAAGHRAGVERPRHRHRRAPAARHSPARRDRHHLGPVPRPVPQPAQRQVDRAGRLALAASADLLRRASAPSLKARRSPPPSPLGRQRASSTRPSAPRRQPRRRGAGWQAHQTASAKAGLSLRRRRTRGGNAHLWGCRRAPTAPASIAWPNDRAPGKSASELGRIYLKRMGHAYGLDASGDAAHQAFETALAGVTRSYHGRRQQPVRPARQQRRLRLPRRHVGRHRDPHRAAGRKALILQHADAAHPEVEPLATALLVRTPRPLPQPGLAEAADEARLRRRPHHGPGVPREPVGVAGHPPRPDPAMGLGRGQGDLVRGQAEARPAALSRAKARTPT
jgi:cobaltochelatase CobN